MFSSQTEAAENILFFDFSKEPLFHLCGRDLILMLGTFFGIPLSVLRGLCLSSEAIT
jgi:hypothetical protein